MGKKIIGAVLSMFVILVYGCGPLASYEGEHKGRVVDAETGEPLVGVVVLGIWQTETPTPGGAVHHFHDARETLTDKNGEFSLHGVGIRLLSNLLPMDVLLLKTGYEEMGPMERDALKEGPYSVRIKWDGERAIIPLKRLTMEERKKRLFDKLDIPDEKQRLLIREVNKERIEIGLPPYRRSD